MADTIAAFSVDEHIRWATARIAGNDIDRSSIRFGKGDEVEPTRPGFIAEQVSNYVARVSRDNPDIQQARSIGVSMIGPVDGARKQVRRVARKEWRARNPDDPVMDFSEVFSPAKHILAYEKLVVHNDATCAALAEWYFQANPLPKDLGLWGYITINAGINCSVFNVSRPLFQHRYRQPEMGHSFPARHSKDPFDPKKHSGCPAHDWCFESLASGDAMQKRWGDDWDSDPLAWDLEAYYVALLALSVMLGFRPDKIVLAGYVVRRNPEFLRLVREKFDALNGGYIQDDKVDDLESFITAAGHQDEWANVSGALVMARDAVFGRSVYALTDAGRNS